MESLNNILKKSLNKEFLSAIISNPREKDGIVKIKIRPVEHKDNILYQCEEHRNNQVFHHNLNEEEATGYIENAMQEFKQMQMETRKFRYQVLVSKKGKIVRTKFDKFRQINRFLEFIEDVLPELPKDREVTILDFGCGKSYLTFAIYYYLHELKGYDIRIIGLDLKTDVIYACNQLAKKYGYRKLKFMEGNIADYTGSDEVDMVVTLHACDTATDFALAKAVGWKAKVILSVPCCQHEVNRQIANETLAPLFSYGLIKERMAALVTDAMRAEYLKRDGYDTQILEFIDMEHTPKNILIRAIYTGNKGKNAEAIRTCEEMLHIDPMLGRLLDQQNEEGEKGV